MKYIDEMVELNEKVEAKMNHAPLFDNSRTNFNILHCRNLNYFPNPPPLVGVAGR